MNDLTRGKLLGLEKAITIVKQEQKYARERKQKYRTAFQSEPKSSNNYLLREAAMWLRVERVLTGVELSINDEMKRNQDEYYR